MSVTQDLDFANPLVFKPEDYAGIAVLRLPSHPAAADLPDTISPRVPGSMTSAGAGAASRPSPAAMTTMNPYTFTFFVSALPSVSLPIHGSKYRSRFPARA